MLRRILPLLCAGVMLAAGLWLRAPTLAFRTSQYQSQFNKYAFERFSYSDIGSLYFRDKLWKHPRPYFDYPLEYPVGTGALIYALNSARQLRSYFLVSTLFLAICGLAIAWLIPLFPRGRIWLMVLSPALPLYVNLNWDMWAVLLTVGALLLHMRGHARWCGVVLAAAVWTKFFPVVVVPLLLIDHLRQGRRREALRLGWSFAFASVVINAPLIVARPEAWFYFFVVNRTRPIELNLWNFLERLHLTTAQINGLSAIMLLGFLAVIVAMLWRGGRDAILPASCAAIAAFFFVNKVYSPQYSLWLVVLLAVAGSAPALAAAWSSVDLGYFMCSFIILGIGRFRGAGDWFYHYALYPAAALREAMILLIIAWCLWDMWRSRLALIPKAV